MLLQKFYSPEPSGAVTSKIGYKFDNVEKEFDLSDPEQYKKAQMLIQRGELYDRDQGKIGEWKKKAEMAEEWEGLLTQVRTGEIDEEDFLGRLEAAGIKLSTRQQKELDDDIFSDDSMKILKKEMNDLKREIDKTKIETMANGINRTHEAFENKYSGKDGLPKYDRDKIEQFIKEKNLYAGDLKETYEFAYFLMNKDEIRKKEMESLTDQKLKKQIQREKAFIESGQAGLDIKPPKTDVRGKKYSEIAAEAAKEITYEDLYSDGG